MSESYKYKCFQCGQGLYSADAYNEHLRGMHGAPARFVELVLYADLDECTVCWFTRDGHPGLGLQEVFSDGHDGGAPTVSCDKRLDLDDDVCCIEATALFPEWDDTRKQRTVEYMAQHLENTKRTMRIRVLNELYSFIGRLRKLPVDVRHHESEIVFDAEKGKFIDTRDDDE